MSLPTLHPSVQPRRYLFTPVTQMSLCLCVCIPSTPVSTSLLESSGLSSPNCLGTGTERSGVNTRVHPGRRTGQQPKKLDGNIGGSLGETGLDPSCQEHGPLRPDSVGYGTVTSSGHTLRPRGPLCIERRMELGRA